VDVTPNTKLTSGVVNRLLCLGCRNVFSATALRDAAGCPGCGNPSFLRLRGPGAFSVLRLDQTLAQPGPPAPREATP
jgi:hypothetical protein